MNDATKKYTAAPYVPTASLTGSEQPFIFQGENMWPRFNRFGQIYFEGYTGNSATGDTARTVANSGIKTLTGTLTWTNASTTVTGSGTDFVNELHVGSFILGHNTDDSNSELLVVEKIVSSTSLIVARTPLTTAGGNYYSGYVLPILFSVGPDRGSAISGKVLRYPKGHYIGVGDGDFRVNGSSLSSALSLTKQPQFALLTTPDSSTYTIDDVGIDRPAKPTISALGARAGTWKTVTDISNASACVVTVTSDCRLYTGDEVVITGVVSGGGGNLLANLINGVTYKVVRLTSTTFSLQTLAGVDLDTSSGYDAYTSGGTIVADESTMRAGNYSVRVCAASTKTLGFSQPTDAITPITVSAQGMIKIVFPLAMFDDQDAYDIYVTQYVDNAGTIQSAYMGPWYLYKRVTADMLKNTGASTTTGREANTYYEFWYTDAEIEASTRILTFNNFQPKEAEFVDLINGIPIYFSCLGKGTNAKTDGKSPGPCAIPSKPSNPESVFLDKTITTAGGDYIIGEFNAKSRIFVLCENTLQALILTTLDDEPIAFRSLWDCGFRNPYNAAFVKDYIYAFSTYGFVRGVAGGDDSTVEFEYASDVREYVKNWPTAHILTAWDPKNRAICHFYAGAERRSQGLGTYYYVTIVLPFLVDKQIWGTPIILRKTDTDFIVSGVATIGQQLIMMAGGLTSGTVSCNTYVFDGGDTETKSWYLAWPYSDDEIEHFGKGQKGVSATGQFSTAPTLLYYGVANDGALSISDLTTGSNSKSSTTLSATSGAIKSLRYKFINFTPYRKYTFRLSGSYDTATPDRFDELIIKPHLNSSER